CAAIRPRCCAAACRRRQRLAWRCTCVGYGFTAQAILATREAMLIPHRWLRCLSVAFGISAALSACGDSDSSPSPPASTTAVKVGVAAVKLTPCGPNPDYDGPISASGVWGETFTDRNANGRWDAGEPFIDDPANTALDPKSLHKYDGIFMAGFGNDR